VLCVVQIARNPAKWIGTAHRKLMSIRWSGNFDLLEKTFVIFRLNFIPARKSEKELAKSQKNLFLTNLGIRKNAIIRNFNEMHLRNDVGGLWETFASLSPNENTISFIEDLVNTYFWRNLWSEGDRLNNRRERWSPLLWIQIFVIVKENSSRVSWKTIHSTFKVISSCQFLWSYIGRGRDKIGRVISKGNPDPSKKNQT